MLSDQEKDRIRAEEIFREEVKKGIITNKQRNYWDILNSSFFLWFCSSILISLFTFFFYDWQAQKKEELQRERRVEQLDLEIKSRLIFFQNQKNVNNKIIEGLLILEKPTESTYPAGVYEEFSQRSLRSLLIELSTLVDNEDEKQEIINAVKKSEELMRLYITLSGPYRKEPSLEIKYQLKSELLYLLAENFNIKRWDKPFGSDIKKEIQNLPYDQALEDLRERFGGGIDTLN